jgi:hypothetical protein
MTLKKVNPIPKDTVDRLFSEEMPLKEYLDISNDIAQRIYYIAKYIGSVIGYEVNYITLENGYREFFGFFNPREYKKLIALKVYKERGGEDDVYLYEDGIPTRFLHENFEEEVKIEYKKYMIENQD